MPAPDVSHDAPSAPAGAPVPTWLVFAASEYYPSGGAEDFVGGARSEQLALELLQARAEADSEVRSRRLGAWEVTGGPLRVTRHLSSDVEMGHVAALLGHALIRTTLFKRDLGTDGPGTWTDVRTHVLQLSEEGPYQRDRREELALEIAPLLVAEGRARDLLDAWIGSPQVFAELLEVTLAAGRYPYTRDETAAMLATTQARRLRLLLLSAVAQQHQEEDAELPADPGPGRAHTP